VGEVLKGLFGNGDRGYVGHKNIRESGRGFLKIYHRGTEGHREAAIT
jgi:hypothetical protein